jgi:hypothetical protein
MPCEERDIEVESGPISSPLILQSKCTGTDITTTSDAPSHLDNPTPGESAPRDDANCIRTEGSCDALERGSNVPSSRDEVKLVIEEMLDKLSPLTTAPAPLVGTGVDVKARLGDRARLKVIFFEHELLERYEL